MKTGVVSCMSGTCSYLDNCLKIPVRLVQCQYEGGGCTNMVHHVCQNAYVVKYGLNEGSMKNLCMECVHKLPEPNEEHKSNPVPDPTPNQAPDLGPADSAPHATPTPTDDTIPDDEKIGDILDPKKAHAKVREKRSSATKHFECYLAMKNKELLANNKAVGVSKMDEIKFEDVHTGNYIGEYCDYLATKAKRWCKPTGGPISYPSAAGYMGSIKNMLLDKFKQNVLTPKQLQVETWKRYMSKLRSTMWGRCRKNKTPMHGTKGSATEKDRNAIFLICLWSGTLYNAEFMNFFQSMVMNCGRGCEIGLTRFEHFTMKTIKEPHGQEFDTLEQYINRIKVMSKSRYF